MYVLLSSNHKNHKLSSSKFLKEGIDKKELIVTESNLNIFLKRLTRLEKIYSHVLIIN